MAPAKGKKDDKKASKKGDKSSKAKAVEQESLEDQLATGAHEETFGINAHFAAIPPPVVEAAPGDNTATEDDATPRAPQVAYTEILEPYFNVAFYDQDAIQSEPVAATEAEGEDGVDAASKHELTWSAQFEPVMVNDAFVRRLYSEPVLVELYGTVEETIPEPVEETEASGTGGKKGKDGKKKDKGGDKKGKGSSKPSKGGSGSGKKGKGDKGAQRGDAVLLHTMRVDLRPMLRREQRVTLTIAGSDLDHEPARSAVRNVTVTLELGNPLLSPRQEYFFNPLAITLVSLEDMPSTPLTYKQLSERCAPVTCKYKFYKEEQDMITKPLPHAQKLAYQHTSIFLSGTWDQEDFCDYLSRTQMPVEVHDRDRVKKSDTDASKGEDGDEPATARSGETEKTGDEDASRPTTAGSAKGSGKKKAGKKEKGGAKASSKKKKGAAEEEKDSGDANTDTPADEDAAKLGSETDQILAAAVRRSEAALKASDGKDPHAVAQFNLAELLSGGRRVTMRSAVKPVRVPRNPGQYVPPDRLAPGNFGASATSCKIKFEFALAVPRPSEPPPLPEPPAPTEEEEAEAAAAAAKAASTTSKKKPASREGKRPASKDGKSKVAAAAPPVKKGAKKGSKAKVVEPEPEDEELEEGGEGADSEGTKLPPIPRPGPTSALLRPKVKRKFSFAVAVYMMQYSNTGILADLLAHIHALNCRTLAQSGAKALSLKQLATCELSEEQIADSRVELVTGVQIIDPDIRLLFIEGNPDVMDEITTHVASKSHCASNHVRLLYNPDYGLVKRQFGEFPPDIYKVKLRETLRSIHHKTEIYSRSQVSELCYDAIISVQTVRKSDKMRDAHKHLPTSAQLLALEKKYLGPLTPEDELVTRREYDPSSIGDASEDLESSFHSEIMMTKHRDDIKIDVYNDRYLRHLRDRENAPAPDFIAENLKRYPGTSRPRPQEVPALNDGLSEEVFIYSGQRLQYTERHKEKIRKQIAEEGDGYYTYSQKYTSLSYCPVNLEELKREEEMRERAKWVDQKGFNTTRQRSKEEELRPDNDITSARKEELTTPWIDPATVRTDKERLNNQLEAKGGRFVTVVPHGRDFDQTNMHLHSIHIGGDASEKFLKEAAKRKQAEEDAKIIVDPKFHLYYGQKHSSQIDRSRGLLHGTPQKTALKATQVADPPRSIFIDEGEEWIEPIKRQLKMRDGDPTKFKGNRTFHASTIDTKDAEPVTRGATITRISEGEKTGWQWNR